jgi:hypothetical protein
VKYGVSLETPTPAPPPEARETPATEPFGAPLAASNVLAILRETSAIRVSTGSGSIYVTVPDTPAEGSVNPHDLWTGKMADGRWVGIVPLESGGSSGVIYALMWVWSDDQPRFVGEIRPRTEGLDI